MKFEHVAFDLPHGTFHALQGGDPDGRPTLVLHGFPDHPPTAMPFLAELGRRGRHVVAPWLRGYAPSPNAGPFDFASLTSDVLALIDRWPPGRAVELVGHDWGALITYDACVTAPERIERAVTLAVPHPLTFMSRPRLPSYAGAGTWGSFNCREAAGWPPPAISPSSTASGVSGRPASRLIQLSRRSYTSTCGRACPRL
ncbi:alpha/beta fold hydrolase [Streptomyces sp. NPDC097610]|uniref:alpha/beta fold hydrolase n=1 Tax=Streptomyces sp. NPDC097610 TaxID=3157227 RepID=UPI00331E2B63